MFDSQADWWGKLIQAGGRGGGGGEGGGGACVGGRARDCVHVWRAHTHVGVGVGWVGWAEDGYLASHGTVHLTVLV